MTDYQERFDSQLAEANSAISNKTTTLQESLFGMHPNQVRRLLTHISRMLGYVDKNDLQHPEYLAGTPLVVPERAIDVVGRIKTSLDSGVEAFLQNVLPLLVDIDDRLTKSVGIKAYSISEIKNAQVKEINRLLDWTRQRNTEVNILLKGIKSQSDDVSSLVEEIGKFAASSKESSEIVSGIRSEAEKLSKGNANQNPLEKLVRAARERIEEIQTTLEEAKISSAEAATSAEQARSSADQSAAHMSSLEKSDNRADEILRNATQAGLAGAYKTERDNLSKEQRYFAIAFYGIIGLIIAYAAAFLLPIFKNMVADHTGIANGDSALMLLVRLVILSPVVWALVFTNRRFRYLETLQMDYAAKTTTALAYSGYSEEMAADAELSKRLKDGLIMRFLEHPSRLLGKKKEVDSSSSGPDGVIVKTRTASEGASIEGSPSEEDNE